MKNEMSRKNVFAIKNKSFFSNLLSYLVLALLCLVLSDLWRTGQTYIGIDYYQYWVAGQALKNNDVKNIYSESDRKILRDKFLSQAESHSKGKPTFQLRAAKSRSHLELFSTPLMYSFFSAITLGDYEKDFRNFRVICLLVFLISLITLSRLYALSVLETVIMIILLTRLFDPYMSDARVGNVNQILVGFLTLFLWLKRQSQWVWSDAVGGFVLGIAVMFKPTIAIAPVLLITVWLMDRRYNTLFRQSLGFCLSFFVGLLISRYYFGSFECWKEWLAILQKADLWRIPVTMGNQSLSNLLLQWHGIELSTILLICLLIITTIIIWHRRSRLRGAIDADFYRESWAAGMGCVIMLMVSKLVWMHYYLLATPLVLYLLRHEKERKPGSHAIPLRKIMALSIVVLYSIRSIIYILGLGNNPVYTPVIMNTATAILLTVAWIDRCPRINNLSR